MSRCPQCGMKECCGADMAPEVEALETTIADLRERLARHRHCVVRIQENLPVLLVACQSSPTAMNLLGRIQALCDAELGKEQP